MLWALALGTCPSHLLARSGQSGRVCSGQIRSHTSRCGPSNCTSNLPIRISGSSSEPVAWAGQSRCWKRPRRWRGGPVKRNVSHPPSGSGSHSNSTNSQASNSRQPVCIETGPRPQWLAIRHHHCLGRPALTGGGSPLPSMGPLPSMRAMATSNWSSRPSMLQCCWCGSSGVRLVASSEFWDIVGAWQAYRRRAQYLASLQYAHIFSSTIVTHAIIETSL
ncbi:hypothetical protein V8C86DRAFT_1157751 [Haematococcus lacustris]